MKARGEERGAREEPAGRVLRARLAPGGHTRQMRAIAVEVAETRVDAAATRDAREGRSALLKDARSALRARSATVGSTARGRVRRRIDPPRRTKAAESVDRSPPIT